MDKDTQKRFAEYTKKRGYARGALTRLENSTASHAGTQIGLQDAYVYLEQLERCYRDFEEYDQKIADIDQEASEIAEFEERFLKMKSKLRGVVHETNPLLTEVQKQLNETMTSFNCHQKELLETIRETSMAVVPKGSIKLPPLHIPPFHGKRAEEFQAFKDLFEATVDKNQAMSDCQKLTYLKGLLKDDAYTFVRHVTVTDANYKSTWEKVCKRYDQPSIIIRSFIKRFLEQPAMSGSNSQSLRKVLDTSSEVIAGIKALGQEAETRDIWLNYILASKLDEDSRKAWSAKTVDVKYPTLESFIDFLEKRALALDNCDIQTRRTPNIKPNHYINLHHSMTSTSGIETNRANVTSRSPTKILKCRKCSNNHRLQDCEQFKAMDLTTRKEFAASSGSCFNCLTGGHSSKVCRSFRRCQVCRKKHHTMLHPPDEAPVPQAEVSTRISVIQQDQMNSNHSTALPQTLQSTVSQNDRGPQDLQVCTSLLLSPLLPTARVRIHNNVGESCIGRVLLDSGSNGSLISEACVRRLNLPRVNARYPVKGIASETITRGITNIHISPYFQPEEKLEMKVYIIKDLPTNLPKATSEMITEWESLKTETLADPADNQNNDIDIVMGINHFLKILSEGQLEGPNKLIAQNTTFGWIIGGGEPSLSEQRSFNINLDFNVDMLMRKFWELEEVPTANSMTEQEQRCEALFTETTYRDAQGRFVVRLPFLHKTSGLGDSLNQARSRFYNLERRLNANRQLKTEYIKFMDEYLEQNHMEELLPDELTIPPSDHFYLPHHPVIKTASSTTKVRVVFDGSAVTRSSTSLNQALMVGPTVQSDLTSIIMRFRLHKVVFTADIQKMYRQVRVHPDHINFQRIIWRKDVTEALKHFKLTTVTYGTASAPYLATRSLVQLAKEVETTMPKIAAIIKHDFYVDDVLSGTSSIKEAIDVSKNLEEILESAGFILHKWASNSKEFLTNRTQNTIDSIDMMKENTYKVLGLHWNCEDDYFMFKVNMNHENIIITKRALLSEASRLFDPLGWLSPVIITVKSIFQRLWLLSLGWDDTLPPEIVDAWNQIKLEMKQIEQIKIPRHIEYNIERAQVHGFCDASKTAYAAALYIRTVTVNGNIQTHLIAAKSKVAPIRRVTIPKLELLAAHLLAKLSNSVLRALKVEKVPLYSWTDSEIVLNWLSKQPATLPTFIANRTAQIHEWAPNTKWQHVQTKCNPCDCASRGLMPAELPHHWLWWHGPEWLKLDESAWPKQTWNHRIENIEKLGTATIRTYETALENHPIDDLFDRISNFRTIKRTLAYCIRFIELSKKCRIRTRSKSLITGGTQRVPPLSCKEIQAAYKLMWTWAQSSEFAQEIKLLKSGEAIKNGSLTSLSPFLDEQQILRVGGRLNNAICSENIKHPILLPRSYRLSHAILSSMHETYLHPTASTLFNISTQRYWIVGGKVLAKKVTNSCKVCFKLKAHPVPQLMGNLPSVRTNPSRCFSRVGVDYAGPFQITVKRARGAKPVKGYVALFVCMAVKAIHLELVMDLSTEAFIAALRRFISRRNKPQDIYSDNGTNFKGANNKLTELEQILQNPARNQQINQYLTEKGIQWHFIPPVTPSMGGLWEAGVKCMKHHLIRATANTILSMDEFSTLLCEIEAILNSRPLTPISTNPLDELPLTPAHFLLTQPLEALPDEVLQDTPESRLDRWQNIQKRVQGYWRRYSKEYLHTLHQRKKWQQQQPNLEIGDLVYIQEENTVPLQWPLGRIIDIHPGKDGLVRVITVRMRQNTLKRPVTKVVKLPVEVNNNTASQ